QGKRAPQQRLSDQQQGEIARGIHVEVQQQRELFQGGMRQQVGFIADQNRMLLLSLVQTHACSYNLGSQSAADVRRFQVQLECNLTYQVQRRTRGKLHIEDL